MSRLRRTGVVAVTALLVATLALPEGAFADEVECPSCWRLVEDGPCRCPHCDAGLPGRTCSTEPAGEPEVGGQPVARPRPPSERSVREGERSQGDGSRPRRRRPRARRPPSSRQPVGAELRTAPSGADERPEPRRRRRRRPPTGEAPERRAAPVDEASGASAGVPEVSGSSRVVETTGEDPAVEEGAAREGRDPPRRRRRRRRPRPDAVVAEARAAPEAPASPTGPALLAGYRYVSMLDWTGEGHTHGVGIEGFPVGRVVRWLRLGLGGELGFRLLEDAPDWSFRGFVSLGLQYPRRVIPYGSVSLGGGVFYRRRFGQSLVDGLFTVGLEGGATFRLTPTFVADLSVGYLYSGLDEASFHSFTFRVAVGW